MQALRGKVTFEQVKPEDLIDVARSVKGRGGQNVFAGAPGIGVDQLLVWSLTDLRLAGDANDASDRGRCAANALSHGRRALACLCDWYLARDCFSLCKDGPLPAKKKADLLLSRGLLDGLSSNVISRAIQKRDEVEHQFVEPRLEEAEDVVELMRRTIQCLRTESDPSQGPFLFGNISHRVSIGANGQSAEFYGWQKPSFLLCSFDARPWLGAAAEPRYR